jgi:hypothetical protein
MEAQRIGPVGLRNICHIIGRQQQRDPLLFSEPAKASSWLNRSEELLQVVNSRSVLFWNSVDDNDDDF